MTEAEWLASSDVAAMLQTVYDRTISGRQRITNRISDRKLRLFACACCRQPEVWDQLTDEVACPTCDGSGEDQRESTFGDCSVCSGTGRINSSRRAVEIAELYADGLATDEQRADAYALATEATVEATRGSIGDHARADLARVAVMRSQILSQHVGQWSDLGQYDILSNTTQAAILRAIAGNPFRPVTIKCPLCIGRGVMLYRPPLEFFVEATAVVVPSPAPVERPCERCGGSGSVVGVPKSWLTHNDGAVVKIARAIYDGRRWDEMPILADALEDAGCDVEEILRHCRGQERCPHCCGNGGWEEDTGGTTPWGDPISQWVVCDYPCNYVRGLIPRRGPHVRGDWVLDLLLGKE